MPSSKTRTPAQQMMRTRKAQLAHKGPRKFPEWRPGMGYEEYVRQYRMLNTEVATFAPGDLV